MLRLKPVAIDTYRENVAFLSRNCQIYRAEEFQALSKVEVVDGEGKRILAVLNIVDDDAIVGPGQLGLSEPAFHRLGCPAGAPIELAQAAPPESLEAVKAKIGGHTLTAGQLGAIIRDISAGRYSKMEIAAFLVAGANFLTTEETLALTRAMAVVGSQLQWSESIVVDKHSVGGVPGNRTSMIVVPIVAAHGLIIPKTSSRAITSPAGTSDTMEVLAKVDLSIAEMREVVDRERGCLVWGGHVNLSPADDIMISVERPLGIDSREQMIASIMSKKVAAGSTHLVIDMPTGPTAKLRSHQEAIRLKKMFEYIGDRLDLQIEVLITDGSQPVGNGVGPVLEARDVMAVLRNEAAAPADLRERALLVAGQILEFDPALRGGKGVERARELLETGQALRKMERIIARQGENTLDLALGSLTKEITAGEDGRVAAIDCYRIARIARLAGAPMDKGAGVDLFKKVGDPVRTGEPLYRIHAAFGADFRFACGLADGSSGYSIAS